MPIRTNRGRAAVYRRLWGWPMRSPNHLVAVLVVVAIVVIAIGIIVPRVTGADQRPTGAAGGATGTSSTTTRQTVPQPISPPVTGSATELPTRIPSVTQTPTSAAADPAALDVVDAWARHWVNHPPGVTTEQWLEPLRPLTTEEFLTEMATVEPGNIDATRVTGPPVTTASYTSSLEATVPTDAGELAITVVETPEGWRVAYYEPAG